MRWILPLINFTHQQYNPASPPIPHNFRLDPRRSAFYDEINGVHLWIGSTLTGSQGSGAGTCTLTVTLHLQTRYGSWSQQLASRGYTGTLLIEYQIAPPAPPTAVPSPKFPRFSARCTATREVSKGSATSPTPKKPTALPRRTWSISG